MTKNVTSRRTFESKGCVAAQMLEKAFKEESFESVTSSEMQNRLRLFVDKVEKFVAVQEYLEQNGGTVLHALAYYGVANIAPLLVSYLNFQPSVPNHAGDSVVEVAKSTVYLEFVKMYEEKLKNWVRANDVEHFEQIFKLLKTSANSVPQDLVFKLFHSAALFGSIDCLYVFLSEVYPVVSIDFKSSSGKTALHYAAMSGFSANVRLLLRFGACPTLVDNRGRTPLSLANNGYVQRLLRNGERIQCYGDISLETRLFTLEGEKFRDCSGKAKRLLRNFLSNLEDRLKLIECLCLIDITADINDTELGIETAVLDSYPPISTGFPEKKEDPQHEVQTQGNKLVAEIKRCCRESVRYFAESPTLEPFFHAFVLTNESGNRSYCFTLTFFDKIKKSPMCVSIISQHPFYCLFKTILFDVVTVAEWSSSSSVPSMDTLPREALPKRLSEAKIPCSKRSKALIIDTGVRSLALSAPPGESFPFVDDECFEVLMRCLSFKNIIAIISSLLSEQSILLVTEHPELAFPVAESLISLLFPFEWVHVYAPLLSEEMIQIANAPFPYLVGMHSKYLHRVDADKLTSVTLVNIDRDSVVCPISPERLISLSPSR